MNCRDNCPYRDNLGRSSDGFQIIRHLKGNYLELNFPIKRIAATTIDGITEKTESSVYIIKALVTLIRGERTYEYPFDIEHGNMVMHMESLVIKDAGDLPLGLYDVDIQFTGSDGRQYRWKRQSVLCIVDTFEEGEGYESDDVGIVAYYPTIEGGESAITETEENVTLNEAGRYQGDENPYDDYADIVATYGDNRISVGANDVTLNI